MIISELWLFVKTDIFKLTTLYLSYRCASYNCYLLYMFRAVCVGGREGERSRDRERERDKRYSVPPEYVSHLQR